MTSLLIAASATGTSREWERSRAPAATRTGRAATARATGPTRTARTEGAATTVDPAAACTAGTATTIDAAPADPARLTAPAGSARGLLHKEERPLVVVVPPQIEPDRLVLALAPDTHEAAGHGAAAKRTTLRRARRRLRKPAARAGRPSAALRAGTGTSRLPLTGAAGANQLEVVVRDRVLELLPEEVPLHELIDARGRGAELVLEQADRADVLLPAPDELFFLLALGLVPPHGQRNRHHDRHDCQRHEQCSHGITGRTRALTP